MSITTPHYEAKTEESELGTNARNVSLKIADLRLVLRSVADDLSLSLAGPISEFVNDEEAEADLEISVDWADRLGGFDEGRVLFDSGSIWRLYELEDGGCEFRLAAPFSNWQTYKAARFDKDWTRGEILCHRDYFRAWSGLSPLEYPLDEVLISTLLARGRGIELHACGLIDSDGSGYLFTGQSGAGKSTTASLWAQADKGIGVLSDERIILRLRDGRLRMYGTPWYGDARLASPDSAPLTRIFFLARGTHNELVPQRRADSAARLFACSFPTFYSPDGLSFALQFLDEVTRLVPCDELRFRPDAQVIAFIRSQEGTNLTTKTQRH